MEPGRSAIGNGSLEGKEGKTKYSSTRLGLSLPSYTTSIRLDGRDDLIEKRIPAERSAPESIPLARQADR